MLFYNFKNRFHLNSSPSRQGSVVRSWGVVFTLKPHRIWRTQRSGRVLPPNAKAKNVRGAGAPPLGGMPAGQRF